MNANTNHTHCYGCKKPFDAETAAEAKAYPRDFETPNLGRCCTWRKGEDDGWGEAPGDDR